MVTQPPRYWSKFFIHSFVMLSLGLCISSILNASDAAEQVIPAADLLKDGLHASNQQRVILIEFSSEFCGFCRTLENEFLKPMSLNQEYMEKVIIRSVSLTDYQSFKDFDGKPITSEQLAKRYNVYVTPTMIFVDENGEELSERLVGIWSLDFFGGFIDDRIDESRKKLLSSSSPQIALGTLIQK